MSWADVRIKIRLCYLVLEWNMGDPYHLGVYAPYTRAFKPFECTVIILIFHDIGERERALVACYFTLLNIYPRFKQTCHDSNFPDGMKLPLSDRQSVSSNGTLSIEPVERSDGGTYACLAENKQGSTSQRSVNVRVMGEYDQQQLSLVSSLYFM
jgi:hypothetical protein